MELGNICFGNSRGKYPVDRSDFDPAIYYLIDALDGDQFFENETFVIRPYYWGDCTCGYEDKEEVWSDENKHQSHCYQIEYSEIQVRHEGKSSDSDFAEVEELCKRFDMSYPAGADFHCTCDYKDRWAQFLAENNHKADCPIIQHNFEYKPTGFCLDWYKYPLRDSYMNQDITPKEFRGIIFKCLESIE